MFCTVQAIFPIVIFEHDLEGNMKIRDKLKAKEIAREQGSAKMPEAYIYGDNTHGQCGIGSLDVLNVQTPVENVPLKPYWCVFIACGANFTAALTENREVLTWGDGNYGQLGQDGLVQSYSLDFLSSSNVCCAAPKKVNFFDHLKADNMVWHLSCGDTHMAALTEQGEVYTWGSEFGGLEDGFPMLGDIQE